MKKVLLFGASGNLGQAIAKELITQGYEVVIVVRRKERAALLASIAPNFIVADVLNPASLKGISQGYDVVISALGKSVSPNDQSKASFYEVDFVGNLNILQEAQRCAVPKFVYVSAFHAEKYLHLDYFRVHHEFAERLKTSGLDYAIIKPPAIFSAFKDLMEMARKGQLIHIGAGDKKTNPIFEGDLAKICVDAIHERQAVIEAGGKRVYTRKELNEIMQQIVNPAFNIRTVPLFVFNLMLPLLKVFNKNMYDKFAFFVTVSQTDTIAPLVGEMSFEDYVSLQK